MSRQLMSLLAAAGAALVAVPAAAPAAQIAVDHVCYADPGQRADTVALTGSGFVPNAPYALTIDGRPVATGTADPTGALSHPLTVPSLDGTVGRGTLHHTFTVAAQDGTSTATAALSVSKLFATFKPAAGNPKTLKVRFSLYGFSLAGRQSPPIYVHYVRPDGRVKQTFRLGVGRGPCGSMRSSLRRLFPFRTSRGAWKLQFDTSKRYRRGTPKSTFLFYTLGVTIRTRR